MGAQFGNHTRVLRSSRQHGHIAPVFGGRSHHGRPADIDVLNGIVQRAAGLGDRRLKWIEIHHQQVDRSDVMLSQGLHMLGVVAARQQPAMNARVQRLDPAVEHFRKTSVLSDFAHRQAGLGKQGSRAACGQELHPEAV